MLKETSIALIKSKFPDEEETNFMKNKCIEFCDTIQAAINENDENDIAISLLIDISLAPLHKTLSEIDNLTIKEQMQKIYNILYEVAQNEFLKK